MGHHRRSCEFRFYEELNDFLSPVYRRVAFSHVFDGTPTVKDRIEALGVPHTEVELILVDGVSVDFKHRLRGGERVAVYPVFECFDVAPLIRLRPAPLRETRFMLDVHLGRLAALLRLLGFDTVYRNDLDDAQIIETALREHRIVLTRDVGILKNRRVTHGGFVHATAPIRQIREVLDRFQLERRVRPFTRCMACNGEIEHVPIQAVAALVPASVQREQHEFSRCSACGRVYWPGGHIRRLCARLAEVGIELNAWP